jgi:phospholipid/cholesterol/gamma-HCH transport system substrate-binding protein
MNDLAGELTLLTRDRIRPLVDQLGGQLERIGGALEEGAPELVAQASELLARLNRSAIALEDTLGPQNRQAISELLANVRAISADLVETRARADALLDELNAAVAENRPQIREAAADLQHTIGALAQRIDAITHHLESSSRNLDEFSREIRRNPNRLLFTAPADEVQ